MIHFQVPNITHITSPSLSYLRKCSTTQQNPKNTNTPAQKIHLSCFALRSTILIVSPLTPRVFATLYNRFCVPFSISFCAPRSPNTARPRSRYSSNCALDCWKNDCSRRACDSRVASLLLVPKERELEDGANAEVGAGRDEAA